MKYSHIFYILFVQLLLLFLAIFIIYDIKFIHIENSYLIKDSLLIASYIAQCGIFLIAIYSRMWYIMIQQMTMYCISLAENEGGYHHVCD